MKTRVVKTGSVLADFAFKLEPDANKVLAGLRGFLRILIIVFTEFRKTYIPLRASALTYTIVLSMVPMLAMSTAILKALGSDQQLKTAAYAFIAQLDGKPSTTPALSTDNPPPTTTGTEQSAPQDEAGLTDHLRNAVDIIFNYVNNTNFAAIGIFGVAGLLFSVILVLGSIESAMNAIWHSNTGRSLFRKIMDYLALIILLPITINLAFAGSAILESPKILGYIHTIIPSQWLLRTLLQILPFAFIVLTLFVMYLFFTTVRVKGYAAFIGAASAAVAWLVTQKIYISLQIGVAKSNAIYGSFATVPLFLIWVHLTWMFILLGATLAFAVQNQNNYAIKPSGESPQQALQQAFDILSVISRDFSNESKTTLESLSRALPAHSCKSLQKIVTQLVNGGLLYQHDESTDAFFSPAMPPTHFRVKKVVHIIIGDEDLEGSGGELANEIRDAAAEHPAKHFPYTL